MIWNNKIIKNNKLNYSNKSNLFINGKNTIHTSAILYSNVNDSNVNKLLNDVITPNNNKLSDLQLIRYDSKIIDETKLSESDISSYEEAFSFLLDEEGNKIDFNKSITLFNGVKLISTYLNKRFEINKDLISEVKISELLEPFNQSILRDREAPFQSALFLTPPIERESG